MTIAVEVEHEFPRNPDAAIRVGYGKRLRVALLQGMDPRVAQALHRAVLASAAEVVCTAVADGRGSFGERADDLRVASPDVVLVQGDERGGDAIVDLVEALRAGCRDQRRAPRVVVAGAHAERVAAAAAPFPVEIIPDLRRPEALAAFVAYLRLLRSEADSSLVLRDEALEALALMLAQASANAVLVVDVTGLGTSLVRASSDGSILAAHAVPLGIGSAADRVVARAGLDRVRRWLPRAIDGPSLLERVFNRARWPDAVAATPLALALEIALAHEAIAHSLTDAAALGAPAATFRDAPEILLTGRLADFPRAAQSLLVALDTLEPREVTSVSRERNDGCVALGALAVRGMGKPNSDSDVEAALRDSREGLALVAPLATRQVATLHVRQGGGRVDHKIEPGALIAFPASGIAEVSCVSPDLHGKGEMGRLGLVVDARGRPLALPPRDADRLPTVARWFAALDAFPGGSGV